MNQFTITKYLFIILCITSMTMLNAGRKELEEKLRTIRKKEIQQELVANNALATELTSISLYKLCDKLDRNIAELKHSSPTHRPFAQNDYKFLVLIEYDGTPSKISPTQIIKNMAIQIKKDRAHLNIAMQYIAILAKNNNTLLDKDRKRLFENISKLEELEKKLVEYEASIIIYKKKQKRFFNF